MFSEYASRYLSRSRATPAPLFNGAISEIDDDSDDNYLGPDSDFAASFATTDTRASYSSSNEDDPPSELLIERPSVPPARASRAPREAPYEAPAGALNPQASNELSFLGRPRPTVFVETAVAWVYAVLAALALVTSALFVVSGSLQQGAVYAAFARSARYVAAHALVACGVSFAWLALVRRHPRSIIRASVVLVPPVLLSTVIYAATWNVHAAVGYGSVVPLVVAALWARYFHRAGGRLDKATRVVEVSVSVINECSALFQLLVVLGGIAGLLVSGVWLVFVAHACSMGWPGIAFAAFLTLMYVWTWGVLCALIQSVLTLVTARWCARRSMQGCLSLSVQETLANSASTACYAALVAVAVRGPLFVLPHAVQSALKALVGWALPSVVELLSPLCYPVSIVHRCSLHAAAADVRAFDADLGTYHLAKVMLTATRLCCSLVTMFLCWVHADRLSDSSSFSAYLVGASAFAVGYVVSGTAENVLSTVVDALLVCFCLHAHAHPELEELFAATLASDYHDAEP